MGECAGRAELQAPGGLLHPHPLLPFSSSSHLMPVSELSVAGISLLPVACKKSLPSSTWTVVEWCCEYILNCSFVISILDVHIVIK